MRYFGNKNDIPLDILYYIKILFDPINGIISVILGFLMDKFGFKLINIIISCIEIGVSGSFYFSANNIVIFIIEVFLVSCCLSAIFTTIAPLYDKVFGKEIALEIYGLSIIFFSISDIPTVLISEYMLKGKKSFLNAYLIGGVISLMKLITFIFFKENNFKSNKDQEYNKIEKLTDIGIDN